MSSKQPPLPRSRFGNLLNTNEAFRAVVDRNSEGLKNLCAKNEYLLKYNGKSVYRQLKEILKTYGFKLSDQAYSEFKLGKRMVCNSVYEWVISSYWGLTPDELRALDTTKPCDHIKPVLVV